MSNDDKEYIETTLYVALFAALGAFLGVVLLCLAAFLAAKEGLDEAQNFYEEMTQ